MADRLRVLCDASPLCDDRRTAGIGRYVDRLTAALRGVDGLDLRVSVPRRPPLRNAWTVRWMHAQPRLAATALALRPHLVHAMASEPAVGVGVGVGRQVVTVHDVVPFQPGYVKPGSPTGRYLAWQAGRLRRCAAVIVVSHRVAEEAAGLLGLDPARVHVIAEGVDPIFSPDRAEHDERRRRDAGVLEPGYVLWVGSLLTPDPRKGLDALMEAIAMLPHARLVMAGRIGRAGDAVRADAARTGARVHLTGWVDDPTLAALYRGAAVLVMPSHHEGFGLPVLEAMASGTPVVAGLGGNLPDLAGDAAELVRPGDAGALEAALGRLLGDPAARAGRSQRALERAAGYSWQRAASETAAVYARVAGAPPEG